MDNLDAFLKIGIDGAKAKKELQTLMREIARNGSKVRVQVDEKDLKEIEKALAEATGSKANRKKLREELQKIKKAKEEQQRANQDMSPTFKVIEQFAKSMAAINVDPAKIEKAKMGLEALASTIHNMSGDAAQAKQVVGRLAVATAADLEKEKMAEKEAEDKAKKKRIAELKKQKEEQAKRQEEGRKFIDQKERNKAKGQEKARKIAEKRAKEQERMAAAEKKAADKKKAAEQKLIDKKNKDAERERKQKEQAVKKETRLQEQRKRIQEASARRIEKLKKRSEDAKSRLEKASAKKYERLRMKNERIMQRVRRKGIATMNKAIAQSGRAFFGVAGGITGALASSGGILGIGSALLGSAAEGKQKDDSLRFLFGNFEDSMRDFIGTFAKGSGVSQSSIRDSSIATAKAFQDVFSRGEIANFNKEFSSLARDITAQRQDGTISGNMENIVSAIRDGNEGAFQKLGIFFNDRVFQAESFRQTGRRAEFLSEREKIDVRRNIVRSGTTSAVGSFEQFGLPPANVMTEFAEIIKESAQAFGQILLPGSIEFIKWMRQLPQYIKDSQRFFEGIGESIGIGVSNLTGMTGQFGTIEQVARAVDEKVGSFIGMLSGSEAQLFSEYIQDAADLFAAATEDSESFWTVMGAGWEIFMSSINDWLRDFPEKMGGFLDSMIKGLAFTFSKEFRTAIADILSNIPGFGGQMQDIELAKLQNLGNAWHADAKMAAKELKEAQKSGDRARIDAAAQNFQATSGMALDFATKIAAKQAELGRGEFAASVRRGQGIIGTEVDGGAMEKAFKDLGDKFFKPDGTRMSPMERIKKILEESRAKREKVEKKRDSEEKKRNDVEAGQRGGELNKSKTPEVKIPEFVAIQNLNRSLQEKINQGLNDKRMLRATEKSADANAKTAENTRKLNESIAGVGGTTD